MTDELATLERRIDDLSHELRARRAVRPHGPTPAWRWFLLGAGISSAAMLALGGLGWSHARRVPAREPALATAIPASVEPPPSLAGTQWYPQAGVGPTLVDMNGDGTDDILGLVWRAGDDERALFVGAWDGKTFDLKWRAGPFPSQWSSMGTHLLVVGGTVVVTDSRETLHVMELGTGTPAATIALPRGASAACALDDRHALFDPGGTNARVLDTVTRTVGPAPAGSSCRVVHAFGARTISDGDRIRSKVKMPGFSGYTSHAERATMGGSDVDLRLTAAGVERDGSWFTYGAGWDGQSAKLLWEHRLATDGHVENRRGTTRLEVGGGRVLYLYAKDGAFAGYHLTARSAKTGEELWSQSIHGSDQGTHISALRLERDRAYVVTSQLAIFDAEHGYPIRTLP